MLNVRERERLLAIAATAIRAGLGAGGAASMEMDELPPPLREPGASFVTLHHRGELRGCIGSLEPHESLAWDVARNAFNAAFRDPRFPPLSRTELDDLDLHISVLGSPEPLRFTDEADLVAQLRPGEDGLILETAGHRGTFLPSVWESLPRPEDFLRHLKRKAGLPADFWSPDIRILRYGTESFGASFTAAQQD